MSALDRNAIRRALRREAAWRRRRDVILLRAALDERYDPISNSMKPPKIQKTPAATAAAAAAPAPFSASRGRSTKHATDDFEIAATDDNSSSSGVIVGDAERRRECPETTTTVGIDSGKNKHHRRCLNADDCAVVGTVRGTVGGREGGQNDNKSLVLRSILEGVMDLAAVENALLRQIVMYL